MRIIDPKDGSIQGSFIALGETVLVFALLTLGFFVPKVCEAWEIMGGYVTTIYPLTFGSWLAYKGAKAIFGKDNESSQTPLN